MRWPFLPNRSVLPRTDGMDADTIVPPGGFNGVEGGEGGEHGLGARLWCVSLGVLSLSRGWTLTYWAYFLLCMFTFLFLGPSDEATPTDRADRKVLLCRCHTYHQPSKE